MRITTFQWQQRVFTAKSYKIKKEMVECVASDGEARSFPLKDLIWVNELKRGKHIRFRVCYRVKQEVSGVQIKSIKNSPAVPGFSTAILPDGSTLLVNRKLNTLYRKDPPDASR
jgi:hypothetical protein